MWYPNVVAVGICFALGLSAQGAVFPFNSGFADGGEIPDGGGDIEQWTDTRNLSTAFGSGYTITDVNVIINVTGGQNGDLYAQLTYTPLGSADSYSVVLVNRVGITADDDFGYPDPGFSNVTLDDEGPFDIHLYQVYTQGGPPTGGTFQPDGRTALPGEVLDTSDRITHLSVLDGLPANGTWALTFADYAESGGISRVLSWSLDIQAVPEPITTALIILGAIFGGYQLLRYLRARRTGPV